MGKQSVNLILTVLEIVVPVFGTNTLELVDQMAVPMMLITLGLAQARPGAQNVGRAAALVRPMPPPWPASLWSRRQSPYLHYP